MVSMGEDSDNMDHITGRAGKTVFIDLTDASIRIEVTDKDYAEKFLGGRGMACILASDLSCRTKGLSSDDIPLIFSIGPLTGTDAPMSGHFCITTISPMTGTVFSSNVGGSFGSELKSCGIDCIVVLGKAATPVYISIEDESISILSAGHLWGKSTNETASVLGSGGKVLCIGKAGECCVPMASIVHDAYNTGRGGHGAVAGSKNLKALVVRGTKEKHVIAEPDVFGDVVKKANKLLTASPSLSKGLANYGTLVFADLMGYMKILPLDNFRVMGPCPTSLSCEHVAQTKKVHKAPCSGCPIGCRRAFDINGLPLPDYDALWSFGLNIGVDDMDTVASLNDVCIEYGMDPISCSAAIASYMEQSSVRLGKDELIQLLEEMGEGGGKLSQGASSYACTVGVPHVSMNVKGLDIPGFDPRGATGMALAYATSNKGACHLSAFMAAPEIMGKPVLLDRFSFDGKAALVCYFQHLAAVIDSLVLCPFVIFTLGEVELAAMLSAATGRHYSAEELLRTGERIFNAERMLDIGISNMHGNDTLPERFFGEGGIDVLLFKKALDDYHHFRDWDEKGIPAEGKLRDLGLM